MGVNRKSADILCRSAHNMKINPNLSGGAILQAIMNNTSPALAKPTFTSGGDKPRSTGPGGVPDKKYSPSSYGDDYKSCLKSLQDLGVSNDRSIEECSTQWKGGKGYSNNSPKGDGSGFVGRKSAAIEIPGWYRLQYFDQYGRMPEPTVTTNNNIKSAAEQKEHIEYMQSIHEDIATTLRNRADNSYNESRIKQAARKDDRPAWVIVTT
jgi:hypothetical protein